MIFDHSVNKRLNQKRCLDNEIKKTIKTDPLKPVHVPLALAREMLKKLKLTEIKENSTVLILCDIGLLFALICSKLMTRDNVWFMCYTKEQAEKAKELNVNVVLFDHDRFNEFLNDVTNKKYNYHGNEMPLKFDVIIGNPPYNGTKRGGGDGSGASIWQKFINISFEKFAKNNGIILMIIPIAWRYGENGGKPDRKKASRFLFTKQMIWNKCHFLFEETAQYVDAFICENVKKYKETEFQHDITSFKFMLPDLPKTITPYVCNEHVRSILSKVLDENHDNGLKLRKAFGGLIKLDYSIEGTFKFARPGWVTGSTRKKPIVFKKHPHVDQQRQKVIISAIMNPVAKFDSGFMGIDDHVHYINVQTELEGRFLENVINSELLLFLSGIFSMGEWSVRGTKLHAAPSGEHLRMIRLSQALVRSNDDVYDFYGLTVQERTFIKTFLNEKK